MSIFLAVCGLIPPLFFVWMYRRMVRGLPLPGDDKFVRLWLAELWQERDRNRARS